MKKLLILNPEPRSKKYTGLAKRAFQLKALFEECGFLVELLNTQEFKADFDDYDLILVNVYEASVNHYIRIQKAPIIIDLYTPFFLENLNKYREALDMFLLKKALNIGSMFLCAPAKQYDFYYGILSFIGGIKMAKKLYALPFYLEPKAKPLIYPNKQKHIAWVGGFWPWFKPKPFLEIIPELLAENKDLLISFVGVNHPHNDSIADAEAISHLNQLVNRYPENIFNLAWQVYDDYLEFLKSLSLAIILHKETPEATYCIRTRYCELLENQIPMIVSDEGYFSDLLKQNNLAYFYQEDLKSLIIKALNRQIPKEAYNNIYNLHKKEFLALGLKAFLSEQNFQRPKILAYQRSFKDQLFRSLKRAKRISVNFLQKKLKKPLKLPPRKLL